jgi:hypothetical protein
MGHINTFDTKEKSVELSITLSMRVIGNSTIYKRNIIHKSYNVNSNYKSG